MKYGNIWRAGETWLPYHRHNSPGWVTNLDVLKSQNNSKWLLIWSGTGTASQTWVYIVVVVGDQSWCTVRPHGWEVAAENYLQTNKMDLIHLSKAANGSLDTWKLHGFVKEVNNCITAPTPSCVPERSPKGPMSQINSNYLSWLLKTPQYHGK